MKRKSFLRKTVILLVIQLMFLILMLLSFVGVSYRQILEDMRQAQENFVRLYGVELENKLDGAQRTLEQMVYHNSDYILLQSEKEADRHYASVRLFQQMQDIAANSPSVDFIVLAEADYGNVLFAENRSLTDAVREALRALALQCAAEGQKKAHWEIRLVENTAYVCKMYAWQNRMAGVFLSAQTFMEMDSKDGFDDTMLLLGDADGKIWGGYGREAFPWEMGRALKPIESGFLQTQYGLAQGALFVSAYRRVDFSGQIRGGSLMLLGILLVSLVSGVALVRSIRREILIPMGEMRKNMEQIKQGDYLHRMEGSYESEEFELLKTSFNRLMDEIVGLKIKSYERQIELQQSELRSIRLQIRPHFFLNAMTTISSLSMQGKNREIQKYIDALSKNIRYIFKSGLHTVPLREEIRHVENYFEMQELKYPGSVFYYISAEPGTENWEIPQMLLHTVIENEYKHAVSVDNMLSIFIKIYQRREEDMLCIEVEDDGRGYPPDVLEAFDRGDEKPARDGSRVGLWSLRKMLELMYERRGLFEISNVDPHGCMNRFLIPREPVCQMEPQEKD